MTDLPKCGLCGTPHLSMRDAMNCCTDQLDDEPDGPEVAA